MSNIIVKEISSKKDKHKFFKFLIDLYSDKVTWRAWADYSFSPR